MTGCPSVLKTVCNRLKPDARGGDNGVSVVERLRRAVLWSAVRAGLSHAGSAAEGSEEQ